MLWHSQVMPVHGPCCIEGCVNPDRSSGQWQYIPEAYCIEHDLTFEDDCSCKKAACLRKCGLKPEKQQPGRKRLAESPPTVGVALHEEELPRPPIILSMDEIWNVRHAASRPPAPPRAGCDPHLKDLIDPHARRARAQKREHGEW
jgi:hypothetical protein